MHEEHEGLRVPDVVAVVQELVEQLVAKIAPRFVGNPGRVASGSEQGGQLGERSVVEERRSPRQNLRSGGELPEIVEVGDPAVRGKGFQSEMIGGLAQGNPGPRWSGPAGQPFARRTPPDRELDESDFRISFGHGAADQCRGIHGATVKGLKSAHHQGRAWFGNVHGDRGWGRDGGKPTLISISAFAKPHVCATILGNVMSDPHPDPFDPFEDAPWTTPREIFARLGYFPPDPEDVDDQSIRGRLAEMIHAMAARRYFLVNTNHLSDAALYRFLHEEWLDESTADIDPDAGWNCHVDVSEGEDQMVWLRYYASDFEREEWASEHPDQKPPLQEEPAFDRDEWLPVPPGALAGQDFGGMDEADDEDPFDDGTDEDEFDEDGPDPLGLRDVEDAIHRDDPMSGNFPSPAPSGDAGEGEPPGQWGKPIDRLGEHGVDLMPPAELTEESVAPKLWELLEAMYRMGVFVLHTDHLNDAELYEALWGRVLREEAFLPERGVEAAWAHDFIGSGSPEEEAIRLAFYASDEERQVAAAETKGPLPPRREPVANRDWRLPRSSLAF